MTNATNKPGSSTGAQMRRFAALEDILMGFSDGIDGARLQAGLTWAKTGRADWQRKDLINLFASPWCAAAEEAGWQGDAIAEGEKDLDEVTAAALADDPVDAFLAQQQAREDAQREFERLFKALRDESWDLRCFSVPTGGDDADIGWRVIGHWQAEPCERTVAEVFYDDPAEAVRQALAALQANQKGDA